MARHATIIGCDLDIWGAEWEVRERRPSSSGFTLSLGWPTGQPRGRGGGGGIRVVVTPALAAYMESKRDRPSLIDLPCGRTAIKRIRRLLGHYWAADRGQWWLDRIDDLALLSLAEFSARHGVSVGAACNARADLLGRRLREADWWKDPSVVAVLTDARPTSDIADQLGIAASSVYRLRAAVAAMETATGR